MMANATTFSAPSSDFVLIKGGSFTMGSPESEDWRSNDEAQHRVTLASFYMAKFEVTQKEWREITGKNPSNFTGDKLPVESITWLEAIEFCNALSKRDERTPVYTITDDGNTVTWNRSANGYRLPTEAEWEYAARAGSTTPFYSRKVPGAEDVNFYGHYPYQIEQNYFNDEVLETRPGVVAALDIFLIGYLVGHGNSPSLNNSAGRQYSLLSPLDCLPAKAGGAVNDGAYAPFILTVDWLGWVCYLPDKLEFILSYHVLPS